MILIGNEKFIIESHKEGANLFIQSRESENNHIFLDKEDINNFINLLQDAKRIFEMK